MAMTLPSHSLSPPLSFKPRITYQILRKNTYSPSAWYVPFTITVGSMMLVGLLGSLLVLLFKAIYRHCHSMSRKDRKPL